MYVGNSNKNEFMRMGNYNDCVSTCHNFISYSQLKNLTFAVFHV